MFFPAEARVFADMMGLLTPHRIRGFSAGVEPETACRARMLDGLLRFEFMFASPVSLIGSALDGWTDVSGASEQFIEWSADRVTWQRRQFVEWSEILRPDGQIEVWSTSRHPLATTPAQFARLGVHYHRRHRNWR